MIFYSPRITQIYRQNKHPWRCVKMKTPYHFVIQTTVGRKNLDDIKDVPEILRYALDDIKI